MSSTSSLKSSSSANSSSNRALILFPALARFSRVARNGTTGSPSELSSSSSSPPSSLLSSMGSSSAGKSAGGGDCLAAVRVARGMILVGALCWCGPTVRSVDLGQVCRDLAVAARRARPITNHKTDHDITGLHPVTQCSAVTAVTCLTLRTPHPTPRPGSVRSLRPHAPANTPASQLLPNR